MYTVRFEGAPTYQANIYYGHGYPSENKDIDNFISDLRKDIKLAAVVDFCEGNDCFIYTKKDINNSTSKYKIPKDGLPYEILKNLRELVVLCDNKKKNKHPFLDYIIRFFINEIENQKSYRKEYFESASFINIILTIVYWLFIILLAGTAIANFSIPILISFLEIFLPSFIVRRAYRSIFNTIKEIVRVIKNRKFFNPTKENIKINKHKILKIRKSSMSRKSNIIKDSIIEEINQINGIVSNLDIDTQRSFQIELYNLLNEYKSSLQKAREQSKGLTLIYEGDVDKAFLNELFSLEARINIFLANNESTDKHDALMEEIANNLRLSLGIEEDASVSPRSKNSEDKPFGRTLTL